MKVDTVEQFKCLEWINQNFYTKSLDISLVNKNTVRIKDRDGGIADITYKNNEICIELDEGSMNDEEFIEEDYYDLNKS